MNFPENLGRLLRMSGIFTPPSNEPYPMDEVPRPNVGNVPSPNLPVQIPEDERNDQYAPNIPPPSNPKDMDLGQLNDATMRSMGMGPNDPNMGSVQPQIQQNHAPDRLHELMDSYPVRENPSIKRKLAASLLGFGQDTDDIDAILYGPYNRKVADWKNQVGAAGDIARQEATFGRLANQTGSLNERIATRNDRTNIAQGKLALDEWKAKHPNHVFRDSKGGNVIAYDPQNPAQPIDTGIPSGTLSDADNIERGITGRKEVVELQGDIRGNLQEDNQASQQSIFSQAEAGRNRRASTAEAGRQSRAASRNNGSSDTVESQSQLKQRIINNAKLHIQKNPADKDWIEFDEQGYPAVKEVAEFEPRGWFSKGLDAKKKAELASRRQAIIDKIFGSGQAQITKKGTSAESTDDADESDDDSGDDQKRDRAIARLKAAKKPVTEANIKFVMKQME